MQYQISDSFNNSIAGLFYDIAFSSEGVTVYLRNNFQEEEQTESFEIPTYRVSDELPWSFGLTEKKSTSLSPKRMVEIFEIGTTPLFKLQSLGTSYPIEKFREDIDDAQTILTELNELLKLSLSTFASDTQYSEEYLRENSLLEFISKLREAEELAASNNEHELHKALAHSRSLAVRSQRMIDQRLNTPNVFKGRASAEGLKSLADMATDRLLSMAD